MSKINYEKHNRERVPYIEKMKTYHVDRAAAATATPSDSQLELIAKLKKSLEQADIDVSYIKEPENKTAASAIIRSLIRIRDKHGIRSDLAGKETGTHG